MDIIPQLQAADLIRSKGHGLSILSLCCAVMGLAGCADYYGPPPAYGAPAPYYGGPGYGYGGTVVVDVNDRPYYTRGAGYYVGRTYYVWRPGHWVVRNGQRYWVHGHYVLR